MNFINFSWYPGVAALLNQGSNAQRAGQLRTIGSEIGRSGVADKQGAGYYT